MKPYLQWTLYLLAGAALGRATGWGLGLEIQRIILDYASPVAPYVARGWRIGLVTGSFLALCALFGTQKPAPLSLGLLHGLLAWMGTVAASCLGGIIGYALSSAHFLRLPESVLGQVGNPNRIFLSSGLEWGAACGALLFSLAAGLHLGRKRRQP